MIDAVEVWRSIVGAARLAILDPRGAEHFGNTRAAFVRSFWAAALVAPFYFYLIAARIARAGDGPLHAFLVELVAYAVGWVAFPVAAHYLAGAWNYDRYLRYIAAYNWSTVIQIGAIFAIRLLVAPLDLSDDGLAYVGYMLEGAFWAYHFVIVRATLNASVPHAVLFVVCDELISFAMGEVLAAIHAGGA